jgi:hypothetical protein
VDYADEGELEDPAILVGTVCLYIAAPAFEECGRELAGVVVDHDEEGGDTSQPIEIGHLVHLLRLRRGVPGIYEAWKEEEEERDEVLLDSLAFGSCYHAVEGILDLGMRDEGLDGVLKSPYP